MQAFVKYGVRPFEAELRELPVPTPGENEVLLSVIACGVCGSDLHAYKASPGYEWVKPPVVLGHEFCGTVLRNGPGVSRFKKGDRVVVIGIQGCGHCPTCGSGDTNLCADRRVIGLNMDGGMATHAVVNAAHLVPLPDKIQFPSLGALVEPLSVAAHALSKAAVRPGERIVISGPGPIGLSCGLIAGLSESRIMVIGTDADAAIRLNVARRLGFDVVNIETDSLDQALADAFNGGAPDLWIEASGAPQAFKTAVDRVRRGGRMLIVGMYDRSVEWMPTVAVRSGLSLFFSYASARRDYDHVLKLMAEGLLDPSPLAQYWRLEDAEAVFQKAAAGEVVKPLLIPAAEEPKE